MKSFQYLNQKENLDDALRFIVDAAKSYGAEKKNLRDHMRYLFKTLDYIFCAYPNDETITIEVVSLLGDIRVRIYYKGEKLNNEALIRHSMSVRREKEPDPVEQEKLQTVISDYYRSSAVTHTYTENGMNIMVILIRKSSYKTLLLLLLALAGGIIVGLLIENTTSEEAGDFIAINLFSSITSIFMNCVKAMIGPLIFFTIASSISAHSDLSSLGRLGKKLIGLYLINALIAIAVTTALILVLKPGVDEAIPSLQSMIQSSDAALEEAENLSLRETILNFFPSNFFKAFTDGVMMQIIFISFLLGCSVGLLNRHAKEAIQRFLSYGKDLFSKMVDVVMLMLPVSVFCSMANTMIIMGFDTLKLLASWVIALLIAFAVMGVIYVLMIFLFAHIAPTAFLKNYSVAITGTFAMGSCNSSMPTCTTAMEQRMKVPNSISSLTIPIGVSIHCASNCVFYLISAFFLANIYTGVEISPLAKPMIFLSVLLLGIGAPSVSGAGPICVATLLPALGVPMGLMTLIIGLDPFISMFKSACSCIEDAAVTLIIARTEKQHFPANAPSETAKE